MTIITGETGAGKSILLGGLSLILGKRADLSSVKDASKKCIVEAVFDIAKYDLNVFFDQEDLDYEVQTIIRREILPSGKSRAFVNDSPVNLGVLQQLSSYLIDIHSQHETLVLTKEDYQIQLLDALADNLELLVHYKEHLSNYKNFKKELKILIELEAESLKEKDYNSFLLNELEETELIDGSVSRLEQEYETLNNVEVIKESLSESSQLLNEEDIGILNLLRRLQGTLNAIKGVSKEYGDLYNRIESVVFELDDLGVDIDRLLENFEADPNRLSIISDKMNTINALFKKHNVSSEHELLIIKDDLSSRVLRTEGLKNEIDNVNKKILEENQKLEELSRDLSKKRKAIIPDLVRQLEDLLSDLGMPNAQFNIELEQSDNYLVNGKDSISFTFTANKGGAFNTLKKSASGGELSRIMFSIKAILSNYEQLPTLMFDEIDTGVSGEISDKMGSIMKQMSKNMQVFSITHQPQIAAKGDSHFKVFKEDIDEVTITQLKRLNQEDRIVEIAQMLSGADVSDSALIHARELLN